MIALDKKIVNTAFSQGPIFLTWRALIIAALLAAMLIFASLLWITPSVITGKYAAYFLKNELDDYGFASRTALSITEKNAPVVGLALVGTAAMREGLLSDIAIRNELEKKEKNDLEVINLMTGGQSALEMAALAGQIAPLFKGVLILGVSPSRLAADPAELGNLVRNPRLAFINPAFINEARATNHAIKEPTGIYAVDNYQFFVARYWDALGHLLSGPVAHWNIHPYLGLQKKDAATWEKDKKILQGRLSRYQTNAAANLASYERLSHALSNRPDIAIVLLDIPLNPRTINDIMGQDFYAGHRTRMAHFAKIHGLTYVNLNDAAGISQEDFQDWSHIRTEHAQQRYTAHLLKEIEPLLHEL